ncbi:hypothetical protein HAX54_045737, partial [Datura stramonium]|nr:hypothetical protein [Datura stramonium]
SSYHFRGGDRDSWSLESSWSASDFLTTASYHDSSKRGRRANCVGSGTRKSWLLVTGHVMIRDISSQVLLKILNTTSTKYSSITSDCTDLLDELSDPVLSHIYRESNNVADILAHYGQTMAARLPTSLPFVTPPTCTIEAA